jgi:ribosome-associated translation inhibitor RaiA
VATSALICIKEAHARLRIQWFRQSEQIMQTSPDIVFEGLSATPQIKDAIDAHLTQLERRWGRITACRVVVKGPGQRHRKGGLYEIRIRLALPDGRDVNITRTPPADERQSDLTFALDDAFKHARRRLQDQVRRMQGHIKHHLKGN